jgi:hypothetical protein
LVKPNDMTVNSYRPYRVEKVVSKDKNYWTIGDGFTLLLCITIPFSLMTTIPDTLWYGILWTTRSNQIVEQGLINNVQQIGIHLAIDFYLPFELISLIGNIRWPNLHLMVARPEVNFREHPSTSHLIK